MSTVTVVIPTIFDHPVRLHLLDQLVLMPIVQQVILVDNGNNFEISPENRELWKKIEVIRPGCNMNWLHSNNLGAALAMERKAPYICFMNDDIHVKLDIFVNLLKIFEQYKDVGVVAPKYNGHWGQHAHDDKSQEDWVSSDNDIEVDWVDGTCMLVAAETFRLIGFLDPSFRAPHWGSEVDYSYRVRSAGLKLYVTERTKLWHYEERGGMSARQLYKNFKNWQNAGNKQFAEDLSKKYGPDFRTVLSLPNKKAEARVRHKARRRRSRGR